MIEHCFEYNNQISNDFLVDCNGKPLHFLSLKEAELFLNNPTWIDPRAKGNFKIVEFDATINEVL